MYQWTPSRAWISSRANKTSSTWAIICELYAENFFSNVIKLLQTEWKLVGKLGATTVITSGGNYHLILLLKTGAGCAVKVLATRLFEALEATCECRRPLKAAMILVWSRLPVLYLAGQYFRDINLCESHKSSLWCSTKARRRWKGRITSRTILQYGQELPGWSTRGAFCSICMKLHEINVNGL